MTSVSHGAGTPGIHVLPPSYKGFSTSGTGSKPAQAGGTGTNNAPLAAWLEDAMQYMRGVQEGNPNVEPATPEFLASLQDQINWAKGQLGLGSTWGDNMATMGGAGAPVNYSDPFGGTPSPDNNALNYDKEDNTLGFVSDSPYDLYNIFGNLRLDVSSVGAQVFVTKTTDDTKPGEEVTKIVIKGINGEEKTYIVRDPEASIEINVPNPDQVTNLAGPDVVIGEFKEGGLAPADVPPQTVIDGTTATIDGIGGTQADIGPTFGNLTEITAFSDVNLSLPNSAEFVVSRNRNGSLKVKITLADGKVVTLNVEKGFKINIDGHLANGSFRKFGGRTVSAEDGVPELFFNDLVTLNGVANEPTNEAEGYSEKVLGFLKDTLGLSEEEIGDLEMSESLQEQIEFGVWPVTQELLNFIDEHSPAVRATREAAAANPGSLAAQEQWKNTLLGVLDDIFPGISGNVTLADGGELEPGLKARTFTFGSEAFALIANGNYFVPVDLEVAAQNAANAAGETDPTLEERPDYDEAVSLFGTISGDTDLTLEEFFEKLDEKGIKLDLLPPFGAGQDNPLPAGLLTILTENDRELTQRFEDQKTNPSAANMQALLGRLTDFLSVLYPDHTFELTSSTDPRYQNDLRVIDSNGRSYIYAFGPDSTTTGGFGAADTLEEAFAALFYYSREEK